MQQRMVPNWVWIVVLSPLIVAFFYAPLALGGTTPATVRVLDGLLAIGFLLWLGLLSFEKRMPRLSVVVFGSLLFLVIIGSFHAFNPKFILDSKNWSFSPREGALAWLPGSVDEAASLPVLIHMGAMLLGGLVLQDAVARSRPRWLLFRVIALAGLVVALLGIYQKASMADAMLWRTPQESGVVFFGAFRYHGNAASFLNLSWPAALAVLLRSRMVRPGGIVASIDLCVFFFILAAVFVNTSKAGQALGFAGAMIMAWRFRSDIFTMNVPRSVAVLTGVLFFVMLAVLILPAGCASITKWSEFAEDGGSATGRFLAYGACLNALSDSGFFGTGAGTFRLVFPFYTNDLGGRIMGFWYHAHQDWLQGLIEWGYLGFTAWAVIYVGALARLGKRIRSARRSGEREITSSIVMFSLALVLTHALVDFPLQIPAIQWVVVFYLAVAWSNPYHGHSGAAGAQKSPLEAG